jgi:RNA polymerase sigma-70 factor (ECF subfamily)
LEKDGILSQPGAFEKAYLTHKNRLLTLATALTGNRGAAEDVVHDVFASLIGQPKRLRDGANLPGYLTVCARNRALDLCRRQKSRIRLSAKDARVQRVATGDDPGDRAARHEEQEMLLGMVNALPAEVREVLALRIWGDLSFEEISRLLTARHSRNSG